MGMIMRNMQVRHLPEGILRSRISRGPIIWLSAIFLSCFGGVQAADDTYEEKVEPLFKQNCVPCHDGKTRTSGFSVATKAELLAGGARRGASIQPGKPEESVLIKVLRGQLEPRM